MSDSSTNPSPVRRTRDREGSRGEEGGRRTWKVAPSSLPSRRWMWSEMEKRRREERRKKLQPRTRVRKDAAWIPKVGLIRNHRFPP